MTEIVLDPGGADELTIDESGIISHTPVKTHTGMGTLRAQLATTKDLLPYAQRKDRINVNINGSTEWTGLLTKPGKTQSDGITSIKAFGIAKKLEESRPDYANEPNNEITISQTALDTAIRNYWPRTPFSASVTDQQTDIVEQDATLADLSTTSELQSLFSIPSNKPFVIKNNKIQLVQSAFVDDRNDGQLDSRYSSGTAELLTSDTQEFFFNFSPQYDITNLKFYVRSEVQQEQTDEYTQFEVSIDGSAVGSINPPTTLGWKSAPLGSVSAGNHTIKISPPSISKEDYGQTDLDVFAVVDSDFTYNFDNTVGSDNGHLDGPELYPDAAALISDFDTTSLNIDSTTVNISIDDTTGGQALGLNYDSNDAFDSASNTTSHTYSNPDVSREVRTRLTLSRYPPQGTNAQSATPRFGYNGQSVSSVELLADLNDRVVIDGLTLTGNHFENLQELHEYGNFQWTIEHSDADIGNLTVNSYREGDETRPTPAAYSTPIEKQSSVDSTNYYNALFLRGVEDSNGNYPTAEVEDTQEINDIGERIDTALTDPNVTTDAGARFRAQALLDALTDENNRRGEITIPLGASITHPGYARSIDFGDGSALKTIEEVRLRESTDGVEQTHVYTPPDNVADEIEQLRREARRQR